MYDMISLITRIVLSLFFYLAQVDEFSIFLLDSMWFDHPFYSMHLPFSSNLKCRFHVLCFSNSPCTTLHLWDSCYLISIVNMTYRTTLGQFLTNPIKAFSMLCLLSVYLTVSSSFSKSHHPPSMLGWLAMRREINVYKVGCAAVHYQTWRMKRKHFIFQRQIRWLPHWKIWKIARTKYLLSIKLNLSISRWRLTVLIEGSKKFFVTHHSKKFELRDLAMKTYIFFISMENIEHIPPSASCQLMNLFFLITFVKTYRSISEMYTRAL